MSKSSKIALKRFDNYSSVMLMHCVGMSVRSRCGLVLGTPTTGNTSTLDCRMARFWFLIFESCLSRWWLWTKTRDQGRLLCLCSTCQQHPAAWSGMIVLAVLTTHVQNFVTDLVSYSFLYITALCGLTLTYVRRTVDCFSHFTVFGILYCSLVIMW